MPHHIRPRASQWCTGQVIPIVIKWYLNQLNSLQSQAYKTFDEEIKNLSTKVRKKTKKSNLPKRVTSGGAHLSGLAPGQHSSEEMSQRWRAVGDSASDLTSPRFEPKTSRANSDVFNLYDNWPVERNAVSKYETNHLEFRN